jgi:hypothetical protein
MAIPYYYDSTGTLRSTITDLKVATTEGTLVTPKEMWAYDSAGTGYRCWPIGPEAPVLSQANGTPVYVNKVFNWGAVSGATQYRLTVAGQVSLTPSLTETMPIGPGVAYSAVVVALDDLMHASQPSNTVTGTMGAMPAPTNLRSTAATQSLVTMAWNVVTGATSYDLYRDGVMIYHGTAATYNATSVAAKTYKFKVRSYYNSTTSAFSPEVSVTTPAYTGPAPQTKLVSITGYRTWQAGSSSDAAEWRVTTDGMVHGRGTSSASGYARGIQTCFFFYSSTVLDDLRSSVYKVKKFRIFINRDDYRGPAGAQACHWWRHKYTGVPAGAPAFGTQVTDHITVGSLSYNTQAWFELPNAWGQALVDGGYRGIAWGGTDVSYMSADATRSGQPPTGQLEITIG